MKSVLVFVVLMSAGCVAPTLAQRQANWEKFRDTTRATCLVGKVDPAMPASVSQWCAGVLAP